MLDDDGGVPAAYGGEGGPRLVGTTGNLYSRTIAAMPGTELLDSTQSARTNETPRVTSHVDEESNYFKSAQW